MSKCKFERYKTGSYYAKESFDCDYLRENIDRMKKEFRERVIPRESFADKQDRAIKEHEEELDKALEKCKCNLK
jgi:hypothetical protein